tara:strand:+ start:1757 stop:2923 length:1167 start_codon:yes stop_codon:yes gene_type:complete
MIKAFKFKLYNSKRNKKLIQQIELASEIYNHCIRLHKLYYKIYHKYISLYTLQKHITKLKKTTKYSHWKGLDAQVVANIPERIDKGYKKFFRHENKHSPTFKSKRKYKSFTLRQTGYKFFGKNGIRISEWKFKFFKSRNIPDNIKTITIKRDKIGDLYIFVACEVDENEILPKTGKTAGFDFGLKMYLTSSDNKEIESPEFFKKSMKKIKTLNKNLSRKQKGCNSRRKARLDLARAYRKISNQRRNFHFWLARQLCLQYDVLCFENLNLNGMKKLWGRKISDLAFGDFIRILEYYAVKTGKEIVKIGRFYPSSKRCNHCGHIYKELNLEDREWVCPECKELISRDYNAACNILEEGSRVRALTRRRDRVRLSTRPGNRSSRKHLSLVS